MRICTNRALILGEETCGAVGGPVSPNSVWWD